MGIFLLSIIAIFAIATPTVNTSLTGLALNITAACSKTQACPVKACCSKFGNCGFGPDFCGSGCLRDCDAKPECGKFSDTPNCPLKVCCSQFGFCGTTTNFCGSGCQKDCGDAKVPKCSGGGGGGFRRIGYYASWASARNCSAFSIDNIDPRNYTHLNFAFASVSGGVVAPTAEESAKLHEFAKLKLINSNLKVLASIGGWVFNDPGPTRNEFHNIALTAGSRKKFTDSVVSFLANHGIDGLDIDWEYPAAPDRGGKKEDTNNYIALVRDLRAAFGSKYLLTIAAPASYWYLRHFKIAEMSKHLDWINVMTYDFHGVWDKDSDFLGPYVRPHTDMKQIESAFKLFWKDGVKPEKLVLGLGYYGRAFTLKDRNCRKIGCEFKGPAHAGRCTNAEGSLAWFEINEIISQKKLSPTYDSGTVSKILSWDDQWVAYDDERTLAQKTEWGRGVCAGGVMIWSIDQGIDRVRDGDHLQKSGSLTIARLNFRADYVNGGKVAPAWVLEFDRDSNMGFDAFIITGPKQDQMRQARQPGGCNNLNVIDGLLGAYAIAHLVYGRFQDPAGQIWSTDTLTINDWDNPVTSVTRRLIGFTARNQPVHRTEVLNAIIHPWHIRDTRSDFTSDYVYTYLGGIQGMDDRGHILQSSLGGLGGTNYYNLAPQYWRLNQHSVGGQDWVAMETFVRNWFRNNPAGYVEFTSVLHYPVGSLTGRPQSWSWALVFSDGTQLQGVVRNEDQSGTNVPRP